jgi:hypothetical protein
MLLSVFPHLTRVELLVVLSLLALGIVKRTSSLNTGWLVILLKRVKQNYKQNDSLDGKCKLSLMVRS